MYHTCEDSSSSMCTLHASSGLATHCHRQAWEQHSSLSSWWHAPGPLSSGATSISVASCGQSLWKQDTALVLIVHRRYSTLSSVRAGSVLAVLCAGGDWRVWE